jgi:hypothetical protein
MHIERMKATIALLRKPPKNVEFDYCVWMAEGYDPMHPHACKTVACAAGMMALYKPFQKEGLRWRNGAIRYGKLHNINHNAVADFLEISYSDASVAFVNICRRYHDLNINDVTPKHVADYLQELLDQELANA